MKTEITKSLVEKIGKLAHLPLTSSQIATLQKELAETFTFIDKIQSLKTENIEETSQITGLENVFRDDKVEKNRILTQELALSNAKDSYKNFFKVEAIFDEE